MNAPTLKQKLCWNCEGSVSSHIENCPYCGVYLSPEEEEVSSSFNIPYPFRGTEETSSNIPKAPYATSEETEPKPDERLVEEPSVKDSGELYQSLIPLLGLTTGTIFSLFALVLALFSTDGTLTLKWNADYWYVYAFIALPCLAVGWVSLKKLSGNTEEA